jgi:hypothetical protein
MKPEQQRIAIAEACGWTCNQFGLWGIDFADGVSGSPPDYLNDLNAMHEAMKTLSLKMGIEFCNHLNDMGILGDWDMLTATAAQRAEAFLKTIEKWEYSND